MKDYYDILGIPRDASRDEIKEVYRKLAHIYHPDKKSGNDKKFREIKEAYEILSDDAVRMEYDKRSTGQKGASNKNDREKKDQNCQPHEAPRIFSKVGSEKWNAFLLRWEECEKYLSDGDVSKPARFLYRFSADGKKERERRSERYQLLLKQRKIYKKDDFLEFHSRPFDKRFISAIIEPTKGALSRSLLYTFGSKKNKESEEFLNLISKEKKFSGNIISVYPASMVDNSICEGLLIITTEGLCCIKIPDDTNMTRLGLLGGSLRAAESLGPIGMGVAAIASHFIGSKIKESALNKIQQTILNLVTMYSACLTTHCFEKSIFVPYEYVMLFLYSEMPNKNGMVFINIVSRSSSDINFYVHINSMKKILTELSDDKQPQSQR